MPNIAFKLILFADDASANFAEVNHEAHLAQSIMEKPVSVKTSAETCIFYVA